MPEDSASAVRGETRRLAAIMFTDIVGFSRQMGSDEARMLRVLAVHNQVIHQAVANHHGHVIKTMGDGFLVDFPSVVNAVQCAQYIQAQFRAHNADKDSPEQIHVRIGIHLGDIVQRDGDVFGDGVNIAFRLQALAEPDAICISDVVYRDIAKKLALGTVVSLGRPKLKGIAERFPVYALLPERATGLPHALRRQGRKLRRIGVAHLAWAGLVMGVLIGGAVIALLSPAFLTHRPSSIATNQETLPLPDKPSIVVLPFVNLSEDPKQEYFSDGITEDLITDLSKVSGLFVIARHSAFTYKGKAVKVQEVGRDLGVRYVLEGSVRKADHRLRISAQLVDTTTGYHLWSERYDRLLQDVFALQDEIRHKIITALKVKLTAEEQARFQQAPTENLEAYDYYLHGVEDLERSAYGTNVQALQEVNVQARQMLEKATELDPQYAAAYARLGQTYLREWIYQGGTNSQPLEQAFILAQKAILLNDSLPIAHISLGQVYIWRRQPELALTHGYRARALAPNDPDIAVDMAGILNAVKGGGGEAIGLVEMAMRLNPHDSERYLFVLGQAYRWMWSEETIAAYKRVLARTPDALMVRLLLIRTYMEAGRQEEARAEASEVLKRDPSFSLESIRQRVPFVVLNQQAFEEFLNVLRNAGLN